MACGTLDTLVMNSSDDPILLLNERQQQVNGFDDLMLRILCQVLGSE